MRLALVFRVLWGRVGVDARYGVRLSEMRKWRYIACDREDGSVLGCCGVGFRVW